MNTFPFQIVTPERVSYEDDIEQVTVPTADGEITVLARHTPLVSLLKAGELRIQKNGESIPLAVGHGFIEVRDDGRVIVLSDVAERAEDIDIEEAQKARERAEELLEEHKHAGNEDFARFEALFEKELARFKVGSKYSRK